MLKADYDVLASGPPATRSSPLSPVGSCPDLPHSTQRTSNTFAMKLSLCAKILSAVAVGASAVSAENVPAACVGWDQAAKFLQEHVFVDETTGATNSCNDFARAAVRLYFHDAGTFDKVSKAFGPNGSIMHAPAELAEPENNLY
ncbi:hypothetical protein BDK51DRAFT_43820, partial [Blyttiomyces helicus]